MEVARVMEENLDIVVRKPTDEEKEILLMQPIWGCGAGKFDWLYDDTIVSLIIDGKADVSYAGKTVSINAGDFVVFPEGLSCIWEVSAPIKKHFVVEMKPEEK